MKTRHWDRLGNGGLTFTNLSMGTAPLGNLYQAISDADAESTLEAAWQAGVRHFDTAPLYGAGTAERRLGRFLFQKDRADWTLSSKVGRLLKVCEPSQRLGVGKFFAIPSRAEVFDYSFDGVMRSVELSLERLGLDRLDVLYAHDLDVFTHGSVALRDHYLQQFLDGGYRACLALREQGVIRAFGAGVNETEACEWLAQRADVDLFLLAGRYTLLEQTALDAFLPRCRERGTAVVIGGAYNSGILATGTRSSGPLLYDYGKAPPALVARVQAIEAVCDQFDVPLAAAALQFPLAHPAVASVIPGMASASRVAQTLALHARHIPGAFWRTLQDKGLLRPDAPVPPGRDP